jgi:hypothetical protein
LQKDRKTERQIDIKDRKTKKAKIQIDIETNRKTVEERQTLKETE